MNSHFCKAIYITSVPFGFVLVRVHPPQLTGFSHFELSDVPRQSRFKKRIPVFLCKPVLRWGNRSHRHCFASFKKKTGLLRYLAVTGCFLPCSSLLSYLSHETTPQKCALQGALSICVSPAAASTKSPGFRPPRRAWPCARRRATRGPRGTVRGVVRLGPRSGRAPGAAGSMRTRPQPRTRRNVIFFK